MKFDVESDQVSASTKRLVFAYYITGHGFGHATRVVEVVRNLILAGHDVHVVTGAPDFVFTTEIQSPRLFLRKLVLDCGAVQADALTVDRLASLEKYSETAVVPRASILAAEVEWLNSIKPDLVVSDVVPVACRAAADAGIRSVCVTNFSWDFIYAEYVMAAGLHHRSIVWQIAEDYSHCEFLIRLPGYCPMPAFRDVIDVPLVVRRLHKYRKEVRKELGIGEDVKLVIMNFGGQPGGWKLKEQNLPSGWLCLVCGASDDEELPPNFIKLAKDAYTPDLIAASDCMLGKIGYGTVSEALAYKLPFVFVRRDYFNEEPFLRNMLEYYQCGIEMIRRDLLTGHWKPYLERAISLTPCYEGGINGGEVLAKLIEPAKGNKERRCLRLIHRTEITVAACILQNTAVGKNYASDKNDLRNNNKVTEIIKTTLATGSWHLSVKLRGARRLQDAIVLGYQLQRVPGRDLCIPDWYANAENELGLCTGSPTVEMAENSFHMKSYTQDFDILHGDLQGLSDTMTFLKSLVDLDAVFDSGKNTEKHWIRERMAAAGIFNWEVIKGKRVEKRFFVARAPGRLDVVGGIADYSGSLVLQMPIREACHVAVQINHPSKHRLWKHAQARQNAKGQGSTPVLQIVSYGSELSNRGPTFDMDLSDFMDGEQPISYQKAKEYFAKDPSQRWAAYVAGVILVLMTELGVHFENSISMLVSSAVPEGKGVSSSASVEVASMSAIAAAHGLDISPRELALLCQKVENHIVGAPCGVMDQMTSACGEANKFLAMICQPAEVLGLVDIPSHIRFWGIDSGIRRSIGGADYGSVRVGAFMGLKMVKSIASTRLSQSFSSANGNADELKEDGVELLQTEASLDYLCNLSPHRYKAILNLSPHRCEALYSKMLPESMFGEAFLEQYADHNDPVTIIDDKCSYGVRAAAKHPIYENFRVKAFKALLTSAASDEQLTALGELMYQCHYSYSACGLGSDGTDRLVQLVQETQHKKKYNTEDTTLYGAKITGGGSGGTICAIGRNSLRSSQQILEIQQRYKGATGYLPFVFEGSSPGAGKFGTVISVVGELSPFASFLMGMVGETLAILGNCGQILDRRQQREKERVVGLGRRGKR
ncbi:arabinose kinase [Actinidia rufa]|uniref:Arabinose kinase n=1 Tax=Actinidia rufa TaxID=165716 RepID=A0A7J0FRP6_9ERIC|nr:arabinose kinase [Actinidia rufa]